MKNRRSFLAAVVSGGAGLALLSKGASAQTAQPALPSAVPSETPTPASAGSPQPTAQPSSGKAPSPMALAIAATYTAFDPQLTEDQLRAIAVQIDESRSAGGRLDPKKKRLRNGDEPVTSFHVPPPTVR